MTMSDRLMSIANMTKGVMSDRDAEMLKELSPLEKTELNEFRKKLVGMPTRGPDRTIDQPTSDVETSRLMNFIRGMGMGVGSMADKPDAKTMSMPTRSPLSSSERRMLNSIKSIQETDSPSKKLEGFKNLRDMFDNAKEGSVTAREVEVAGEFEDMVMKLYQEAVEQGYKGTFFDFLIDRMDTEFDPSSPMRVSKLPEGIMQLMNMMQNRRT